MNSPILHHPTLQLVYSYIQNNPSSETTFISRDTGLYREGCELALKELHKMKLVWSETACYGDWGNEFTFWSAFTPKG